MVTALATILPCHASRVTLFASRFSKMRRLPQHRPQHKRHQGQHHKPGHEGAVIDLASLYEKEGKPEKAIELYKDFLNRYPAALPTKMRLGQLYAKQKRYEEAEKMFRQEQ